MKHEDWLGDEVPSRRADPQPVREQTGFHLRAKGQAGALSGEFEAAAYGPGRPAVALFTVAVTSIACSVGLALICYFAGVPALLLAIVAVVAFAVVLAAGLIFTCRK